MHHLVNVKIFVADVASPSFGAHAAGVRIPIMPADLRVRIADKDAGKRDGGVMTQHG